MRTKLTRTAAVLSIVLLAGAGAASETFGDTKLRTLDAKRPAAAALRKSVRARAAEQARLEQFYRTVQEARTVTFYQALADAEASTHQSSESSGGGDFLACTRERESHGDYGVISSDGQYHGAYQFLQSTWNNTANSAGRPDLVGLDPASASSADQDAMATHLYSTQGSSPWGGRCG